MSTNPAPMGLVGHMRGAGSKAPLQLIALCIALPITIKHPPGAKGVSVLETVQPAGQQGDGPCVLGAGEATPQVWSVVQVPSLQERL